MPKFFYSTPPPIATDLEKAGPKSVFRTLNADGGTEFIDPYEI